MTAKLCSALAVVLVVAGFTAVALAQTWEVQTDRDEFDGTLRSYAYGVGDDSQLAILVGCDGPDRPTMSIHPGPMAEWSVFENGYVDFRFDDRPGSTTERFRDGDTILTAFGDLGIHVIRTIATAAVTLTVRVDAFRHGLEVDTFNMHGFVVVVERVGCAVDPYSVPKR